MNLDATMQGFDASDMPDSLKENTENSSVKLQKSKLYSRGGAKGKRRNICRFR